VNGQVLATAGIEGGHVLSACVNSSGGTRRSGAAFERLWLHLGGLASGDGPQERMHLDWLVDGRQDLKVGDAILVEIVDVDAPDDPTGGRPAKPRRLVALPGGRPTGR
jgi:hypothetical protein